MCLCAYALFYGGPSIRMGAAIGTYLLPVGLDHIGVGPTVLIGLVRFVRLAWWAVLP